MTPRACPFCGERLEPYRIPTVRPPGELSGWRHPKADCFLSGFEVEPEDLPLWNKRTRKKT